MKIYIQLRKSDASHSNPNQPNPTYKYLGARLESLLWFERQDHKLLMLKGIKTNEHWDQ